jgi:hypothetical protein
MWGIWSVVIGGAVGGIFLALGLVVGASPIFALVIFAIVAVALGGFLIARGASGPAEERAESGWRSTQPQPRSGGAPASGEGGPPPSGEAGMPPR